MTLNINDTMMLAYQIKENKKKRKNGWICSHISTAPRSPFQSRFPFSHEVLSIFAETAIRGNLFIC